MQLAWIVFWFSCIWPPPKLVCAEPCAVPVLEHSPRRLKIGILFLFKLEMTDKRWNRTRGFDFGWKIKRNRLNYAKLHSYDVLDGARFYDKSRPIAWSKFAAILGFLDNYDYIMSIDTDAVIMQPYITIESRIYAAPEGTDIIITEDWSGLNSGVFLVKNTDWSKSFLYWADSQHQLVDLHNNQGIRHLFEYEQRAFHYFLGTPAWLNSGLPPHISKYESLSEKLSHFYFLPQCSMNSYWIVRWEGLGKGREYEDGDFIIHFAGDKNRMKDGLRFSEALGQALDSAKRAMKEMAVGLEGGE